ncbi:MAG: TIGR03746 family integrating conjugative element protein [Candidatus Paceibacterota bacterium]|jgi:integrating conjugative element protein (TIGR03746 family)
MPSKRNQLYNLDDHITTLRWVIAALLLVCLALAFGWDRARSGIRIHLPPDLRQGAVVRPNDPKPADIYAFALSIIQVINHWQADGAQDYPKAIESVKPYLTPRYYAQLVDDSKHRIKSPIDNGGVSVDELTGRGRTMMPVPGHNYAPGRVLVHGGGSWTVLLDLHIDETVKSATVKSINVSYPLRVVSYDVDANLNEWGLALDGYDPPGPSRLLAEPDTAANPAKATTSLE